MEAEQNIEPVKANISKEINIELGGPMGWNVPRKTGKNSYREHEQKFA